MMPRAPQAGVVYLALLTLLASQPVAAQDKWKGSIVKEGDVTVVKNPKEPIYRTSILELKEDLTLGGAEAQGNFAFSQVVSVVVDDTGTIYVLDLQASHIKAFDATGHYLRTIGRRGQGPGELEFPMSLSLNLTSDELAVQLQSRGMVFFRTDGTFLRQLALKGRSGGSRVDSRGQIYVIEFVLAGDNPRYATKKLGTDGTVLATISETPAPAVRGGMGGSKVQAFVPFPIILIDRDDRLIYGYPETYDIQFYGPADAKALKRISRKYNPVAVTEEEKERIRKAGMKIDYVFPKDHSAYKRFFLSDLGHLFVQTWEKADGGKFLHDIFDADGRFIGRIPLKPSGIEILKGKYYALEEDDDGFQYVKRYAVTWKIK